MLVYVALTGSQTGGESLKMELSQEGFSAAYVPEVIKIKNSPENIVVETQMHFVVEKHEPIKTYLESRY